MRFTGYLKRTVPEASGQQPEHQVPREDFILVTPGGGGDGAELIDWVLSAYESDAGLPHRAVLLMGPFMPVEQRLAFQARAARDPRLEAITFEARVESFFEQARGVVAMGGYNTFCEILSFGKPALLVPRTTPRLEQYLRAERAQRLGLVRMLPDDGARAPALMAAALRALPAMPVLAEEVRTPMLQGLERITKLAAPWLAPSQQEPRAAPQPVRLTALPPRVAVLVKGYPRLSETFIAQEMLALERLGLEFEIVSLRHPTDGRVHPLHEAIRSPVRYLPEYLYQEPWRVLRALVRVLSRRCVLAAAARLAARPRPRPHRPTAAGGWARPGCWRPSCPRPRTGCMSTTCTPRPRSPATPQSCAACPTASPRTPRTSGPSRTGRSARRSPTHVGW